MTPAGLPVLKPRELLQVLERMGFVVVRKSRGSHSQLAHPDGRRTTVAMHAGCDIGPGLLRKILRDIGMGPGEFQRWLQHHRPRS